MKWIYSYFIFVSLFIHAACSSSNDSSNAANSDGATSTQLETNPDPVKDLKATYKVMSTGKWEVTLTWTNVKGVKSYNLKRGQATKVYDDTYYNVTNPYTISNLEAGSVQYIVVVSVATVNNVDVAITSTEYSFTIPLDAYTEKPGTFTMSAVGGDGEATISWTDADRAVFYVIQSGTSSGSYPNVVHKAAKSPYVDKNLTNGQTRYYMVIAVNSVGSTNAISEGSALPLPAPGSFGVLTAIAGDRSATISWGTSAGATRYVVRRSLRAAENYEVVKDPATSPFVDSNLDNGTTYHYIVSAFNDNGQSLDSNSVSVVPGTLPSSFSFGSVSPGDSQVSLSWASSSGATSYTVQYGESSGSYPIIVSNTATSPFVVGQLTNGHSYYFMVIAVNAIGSTNAAAEVSASPLSVNASWSGTKQFGGFGRRYGTLSTSPDGGVVTDSSGNIYEAGWTEAALEGNTLMGTQDFFIAKYDSSGSKQWTKQLGATGAASAASGIAIDGNNNLYITGYTQGNFDNHNLLGTNDFFIAKYDSSGTKLWTQQYGTSGIGTFSQGIALDSNGNIYISGFQDNSTTFYRDFFLKKYDNSGNEQWTQLMSVDNADVQTAGLAVDASSNIYVTGYISTSFGPAVGPFDGHTLTGLRDYFLIKYDNSGSKQWSKLVGVSGASTSGLGIACDSSNVYIVGATNGSLASQISGYLDAFVAKYDSSGNNEWTSQLGASGGVTFGYKVVSDASSNSYITGFTSVGLGSNSENGLQDAFIAKYDSSGVMQWVSQKGANPNSNLSAAGITLDASLNVYVTGHTDFAIDANSQTGHFDAFLLKYDNSGVSTWSKQLGGFENLPKETTPVGLVNDSSGNVYIAGTTEANITDLSTNEFFLTKYDNVGVKQWTRQLGAPNSTTKAVAIAKDAFDQIYVTGTTIGSFDGNSATGSPITDLFLIKYDTEGSKQWSRQLGSNGANAQVKAITSDPSSNIYVAGYTDGDFDGNTHAGLSDLFITKYDSFGVKLWTTQFGTPATYVGGGKGGGGTYRGGRTLLTGIVTDHLGDIYVTGVINYVIGGSYLNANQMFLIKYNSLGVQQWAQQLGADDLSETYATSITMDAAENIYVAGYTFGNLGGQSLSGYKDLFIAKYTTDGTRQSVVLLGADDTSALAANAIKSDSGGNLYVTGITDGNIEANLLTGLHDIFVMKFDNAGVKQWTRELGATGATVSACALSLDTSANVFITGAIDQGLDGNVLTGTIDTFVAKYSSAGIKQ